ncbi:MAG: lytic transglycosylase domain-containing protein [Henriciella sp.]|nr:lytic transglycosylase domain-containing protein [Henriciella sp.]
MKLVICSLVLFVSASPANAERPWWIEGSFAPIDLYPLAQPVAPPPGLLERLPSVLTLIQSAAERHAIDPELLRALVAQESAYDPSAVSEDGAIGLGQLMPVIANWCGVKNRFHRVENIDCAARHLRVLLTKYHGDERLALAAYNAGEPAVDRCGCVPNYPETQDYVARIMVLRGARKEEAS